MASTPNSLFLLFKPYRALNHPKHLNHVKLSFHHENVKPNETSMKENLSLSQLLYTKEITKPTKLCNNPSLISDDDANTFLDLEFENMKRKFFVVSFFHNLKRNEILRHLKRRHTYFSRLSFQSLFFLFIFLKMIFFCERKSKHN